MEITEITVLCKLAEHPTIPIDRRCIFAVFEDGERAIAKSAINNIPDWVLEPKMVPKFLYDISKDEGILRNEKPIEIECKYYRKKMILKCARIKRVCVDMFKDASEEMFRMLGTSCTEHRVLYKASLDIEVKRKWDCNIMADIITNCSKVSRHMSVNETSSTIGSKRMFPVIIVIGREIVKGVIMPDVKSVCKIKLSKLSDPEDAERAFNALKEVFSIYEEVYDKIRKLSAIAINFIDEVYEDKTIVLKGISALREAVPSLFVSNYTRECPLLPMIVSERAARDIIAEGGKAIRYPKEDGKWYTAQEGLFVGLKKNRLNNRIEYPYLVTCYVSDHIKRINSVTYAYYEETQKIFHSKRRPLPRIISMMSSEYCRTKLGSDIIEALEFALDTKIDRGNLPCAPQLVKQELWNVDDKIIMQTIKGERGFLPGSLTFRYFEELLKVSIHVIVINGGVFEPMIPRHEGEYIWSPPYEKNIILFENKKTTYREGHNFYEILMKKKGTDISLKTVFEKDNEIVKYIVSQKKKDSVEVEELPEDALEQVIDKEGKCRIIKTLNEDKEVLTRPLHLPVIKGKDCFMNLYTNKMKEVFKELGICTTDCKKTSTEHIKYFSNDRSFKEWLKNNPQTAKRDL